MTTALKAWQTFTQSYISCESSCQFVIISSQVESICIVHSHIAGYPWAISLKTTWNYWYYSVYYSKCGSDESLKLFWYNNVYIRYIDVFCNFSFTGVLLVCGIFIVFWDICYKYVNYFMQNIMYYCSNEW